MCSPTLKNSGGISPKIGGVGKKRVNIEITAFDAVFGNKGLKLGEIWSGLGEIPPFNSKLGERLGYV